MKTLVQINILCLLFAILMGCTKGPDDAIIQKKIFDKIVNYKNSETQFKIKNFKIIRKVEKTEPFEDKKFEFIQYTIDVNVEALDDLICNESSDNDKLPYCRGLDEFTQEHNEKLKKISEQVGQPDPSTCRTFSLACRGRPYTKAKIDKLISEEKESFEKTKKLERNKLKKQLTQFSNLKLNFECMDSCRKSSNWK